MAEPIIAGSTTSLTEASCMWDVAAEIEDVASRVGSITYLLNLALQHTQGPPVLARDDEAFGSLFVLASFLGNEKEAMQALCKRAYTLSRTFREDVTTAAPIGGAA